MPTRVDMLPRVGEADLVRAWRFAVAASGLALLAGLLAAGPLSAAPTGTLTVSLSLSTPHVFAGESFRARVSVSGASSTCSLQAVRANATRWTALGTVTLRAGRHVRITVAT